MCFSPYKNTSFCVNITNIADTYKKKLEIGVLQNPYRNSGGGCTAGRNFGGVSICVRGFSPSHLFVFFETKNVGRRSFRWFAYRSPSAIFIYHAPIGLHKVVQHFKKFQAAFPNVI